MGQTDKSKWVPSKSDRDGLRLIKAFERITDPEERLKIIAIAEAAAEKAANQQR